MKLLVTGGAGFIGSHTVVELVLDGHETVVLDSFENAKRSVIDRLGEICGLTVPVVEGDVRDAALLDRILEGAGFDGVVHFAGRKAVGESVEVPLDYYDVNVSGSITLLSAMRRHGVRIVVFSSSATVYGEAESLPLVETAPTRPPTNPYGRSKLMVEQILEDVAASDPSWRIGVLRYFNPVGAHESGLIGEDPNDIPNNLVPYIAQVATERLPRVEVFGGDYPTPDGTGIRDYIHVVDLARGHLGAIRHLEAHPGHHVWNLGTGTGTSVLEMIRAFERASGVVVPYEIVERRPGDVAASHADPGLAERELGWKAERDVDDMCRDAWRWQQYAERLDD